MDSFISELLAIGDRATRSSPLPTWTLLLIAAAVIAGCLGPAWRVTQYPYTVAHELGHTWVAWFTGHHVTGIKIRRDTSGVTHFESDGRSIGSMLTLCAGYTGPPIVGAVLAWLVSHGWAGAAMLTLALLCGASVLLARNLLALVCLGGSAAATIWLAASAPIPVVTGAVEAIAVYLAVTSVKATVGLANIHRRGQGQGSDADQLRGVLLLPATAWVTIFGAVSIAAAGWQALALTALL